MASISQTSPSAFIRFLRRQQNVLIIWGVLVVIFIIASFLSDAFTGPRNLINLTRQSAALLLVALAQTFILISGGIDISVGSTVSLIVMVMAPLMTNDPASMFFVALLGVGVGTVVGLLNGIFVTHWRRFLFSVVWHCNYGKIRPQQFLKNFRLILLVNSSGFLFRFLLFCFARSPLHSCFAIHVLVVIFTQ
jgi:predicted ABC-type sugar transport system permease subunit